MEKLTWENIQSEITKAIPDLSDQDKEALFFLNVDWTNSTIKDKCFFLVLNEDREFIYISDNVVDTLGHKASNMLHHPIFDFTPDEDINSRLAIKFDICDGGYPLMASAYMDRRIKDNYCGNIFFVLFPGGDNRIFAYALHYGKYHRSYKKNQNKHFMIQRSVDTEAILTEYDILRGLIEAALGSQYSDDQVDDSFKNGLKIQTKRFEEVCKKESGLNLGYWWNKDDFGQTGI